MHELKICSTSHDKLKDGLTEHTSKKKRNKQTKGKNQNGKSMQQRVQTYRRKYTAWRIMKKQHRCRGIRKKQKGLLMERMNVDTSVMDLTTVQWPQYSVMDLFILLQIRQIITHLKPMWWSIHTHTSTCFILLCCNSFHIQRQHQTMEMGTRRFISKLVQLGAWNNVLWQMIYKTLQNSVAWCQSKNVLY